VAESAFEFRLERMFAESPTFADAERFTAAVLARLDRGWIARRLVIGAMGAAGGLIGVYEAFRTGALGELDALVVRSAELMVNPDLLAPTLPVDPRLVAVVAVGILIGAGLGLARLARGL
jgi:hypothetical protein